MTKFIRDLQQWLHFSHNSQQLRSSLNRQHKKEPTGNTCMLDGYFILLPGLHRYNRLCKHTDLVHTLVKGLLTSSSYSSNVRRTTWPRGAEMIQTLDPGQRSELTISPRLVAYWQPHRQSGSGVNDRAGSVVTSVTIKLGLFCSVNWMYKIERPDHCNN